MAKMMDSVAEGSSWFILVHDSSISDRSTTARSDRTCSSAGTPQTLKMLEKLLVELQGDPTVRAAVLDVTSKDAAAAVKVFFPQLSETDVLPRLKFLHQGDVFDYSKPITVDDMLNFALSGYMSDYGASTTHKLPARASTAKAI
eukprot:CAMPEP_0175155106 /NCGR_PEP_ID=MMETSP0087-20121206/20770_1 /TAXON_ID=136419 /ORGANISM="Unknown Unknown, Strain D1" /LENGTH=143 /DNA_ID=CAMNT_0016442183 /DNA_START=143 /DNA_END=574 /DNA_ORIENTATION=+